MKSIKVISSLSYAKMPVLLPAFYGENMRLPIFLDTDPGIDDAVAIAAAIFAPNSICN